MNAYLDDDENVKAMRETARVIGLTQLLINITCSLPAERIHEALHEALRLLGVSDTELEPS